MPEQPGSAFPPTATEVRARLRIRGQLTFLLTPSGVAPWDMGREETVHESGLTPNLHKPNQHEPERRMADALSTSAYAASSAIRR